MVRRGQCEFGIKALAAVAAGAVGVVVIDRTNSTKKLVRMKTEQDEAKILHVPVVNVLQADGNKIVQLLSEDTHDCHLRIVYKVDH